MSNCMTAYTDGKPPSVVVGTNNSSTNTDASDAGTKVVMGGVLNGQALNRVAPDYPRIGKNVRAQGAVTVQVIVDETGKIVSACAVSGHPLLRKPAVEAAMKWQFPPTRLSGIPVAVNGTITFNFRLEEPTQPAPSTLTHKP